MNVKTNAEMTEQRVQSHARLVYDESQRNCDIGEREWPRKLTTSQTTATAVTSDTKRSKGCFQERLGRTNR